MNIALLYVLIIAPLLLYIGIAREQVPDPIFKSIALFGIGNLLINSYWLYFNITDGKPAWMNYINLFLVSPLLIVIGLNGKYSNNKYYEMLLMIAFAMFGYHLLSIIREIISR